MAACMTVSISNIHPRATKDDIILHFNSLAQGSNPRVGPMVPYIKTKEVEGRIRRVRRVATTVTFQGKSHTDCEYIRESTLHGSLLLPKNKKEAKTDIAVKREFLGLSPLQQHNNHQFDFLFVHGLGGHPFNSWTSGIDPRGDAIMWPRDLLPKSLLKHEYCGRYSTVGYKTSTPGWQASSLTTINNAAEDLLAVLREGKLPHDHRPIYFACHSLGGLVLCQIKPEHQNIFMRGGKCNVKGIIFFATPFKEGGSVDRASYAELVLGGNTSLINSMKSNPKELAIVLQKFELVQAQHDIKVLIYHENQPLHKRMLHFAAPSHGSTKGSFIHKIKPIALKTDHENMIKFATEQDRNYERVSQDIINLLKATLPKSALVGQFSSPPASPQSSNLEGEDKDDHVAIQDEEKDINAQIPHEIEPKVSFKDSNQNEGSLKRNPDSLQSPVLKTDLASGRSVTNVPQHDASKPHQERRRSSTAYAITNQVIPTLNASIPEILNEDLTDSLDFHKVLILDDSGSMREPIKATQIEGGVSRWEGLIECVQELHNFVAQVGNDRIDVNFLINQDKNKTDIQSSEELLQIFDDINIDSSGTSSLDNVLSRVLYDYLEEYRRYLYKTQVAGSSELPIHPPKPINVIVITDAISDDHEKVEATIVRAARVLPHLNIPDFQVGIQFVQIGDSEDANRWLKILDDKIRGLYGIRDICDTRTYEVQDDFRPPVPVDDAQKYEALDAYQEKVIRRLKELEEILRGSMDPKYQGFKKPNYWPKEIYY